MGKNTHNLALSNETHEQESQTLLSIPETPVEEANGNLDFTRQRSRNEYQGRERRVSKMADRPWYIREKEDFIS